MTRKQINKILDKIRANLSQDDFFGVKGGPATWEKEKFSILNLFCWTLFLVIVSYLLFWILSGIKNLIRIGG